LVRKLDTKRTKIVCTIGPASDSEEVLRAMIRAGMDVARINFSHGDDDTHLARIERIRKVAAEEDAVVAILCDLQGPKFRLGKLAQEPIMLKKGEQLRITSDLTANGANNVFPMPHPDFIRDVKPGEALLLDDGALEFMVTGKEGDHTLVCDVVVPGPLSSRKGVSAPASFLSSSALPEKDRKDVEVAIRANADFLAMSFVRNANDLRELRWLLKDRGGDMAIISKIEKHEALVNIDEIIDASDGIMVARGDLGVETPAEMVPIHQKDIIRRCNLVGKPVITATQMLQSMVNNKRPTRAEATDVANAIWDGTDAVMLSNETAAGQYPIDAVQTMATIALNAETHFAQDARRDFRKMRNPVNETFEKTSDAVSRAATQIAQEINAKWIVTSTMSGYTAYRVARQRPAIPILALTPDQKTMNRMALVWGVVPMLVPDYNSIDEMLMLISRTAYEAKLVNRGDVIVIVAGVPFRKRGSTNFIKIHTIGEVGEIV
jgi:pyruvate kinase